MPDDQNPRFDPKTAQDLAALLADLSHDKKTRGKLGRLIKEFKPDSPHAQAFPEVDLEERFEALERERKENELKARQEQWNSHYEQQRQNLLTGGPDGNGRKYDEETLGKIKSLMDKKGIIDWEDGATLYAATQPPPAPPSTRPEITHGATWEIPEFAKFAKDPTRASREVAYDVIDELKRKRA